MLINYVTVTFGTVNFDLANTIGGNIYYPCIQMHIILEKKQTMSLKALQRAY